MGYFYIDDSVHDQAGFVIGALVYSENDLNSEITEIISSHNFDPNIFEFKSSANYSREPEKSKVRDSLKELVQTNIKLGIVIIPRDKREELGNECIKALKGFIGHNNKSTEPIKIYFDQGMFSSIIKTETFISEMNFDNCEFFIEQDSKMIKGIQLADLCAHICSIQLKDSLGLITKKVKAGENSGYDPDSEIDLGFEMWATLRYNFFHQDSKILVNDPILDATVQVEPNGLYISDLCNSDLKDISRQTFGKIYLGCIH